MVTIISNVINYSRIQLTTLSHVHNLYPPPDPDPPLLTTPITLLWHPLELDIAQEGGRGVHAGIPNAPWRGEVLYLWYRPPARENNAWLRNSVNSVSKWCSRAGDPTDKCGLTYLFMCSYTLLLYIR